MTAIESFHKLAIKRGLTPGAMLDANPRDFNLLLVSVRREFDETSRYSEREVNEKLKNWLNGAGGMLDVDHVELRRWLVDLQILARDVYGQAYVRLSLPQRMQQLDAAVADIDFAAEFTTANEQETQRRAARKAAWRQPKASV